MTPRADRWIPSDGYFGAVQWAGIIGVVVVLAAVAVVLPALVRLVRAKGWAVVQTPILRAALVVAATTAFTAALVISGAPSRRARPKRRTAAVSPDRPPLGPGRRRRARVQHRRHGGRDRAASICRNERFGHSAGWPSHWTLIMMVIMAGSAGVVGKHWARTPPGFLGNGALATSNGDLPPAMIVAGALGGLGVATATTGAVPPWPGRFGNRVSQ